MKTTVVVLSLFFATFEFGETPQLNPGASILNFTRQENSKSASPKAESRYYITFIAREPSVSPFSLGGHAFVLWIKIDEEAKQTQTEAFGLYPESGKEIKSLFGKVPGELSSQYLKKQGVFGDVELRIQVSAAEFEKTLEEKRHWEEKFQSGETSYRFLSQNCVNFTDQIAKTIGKIDKSFQTPSVDDNKLPYRYIDELAKLNYNRHIPLEQIFDLSLKEIRLAFQSSWNAKFISVDANGEVIASQAPFVLKIIDINRGELVDGDEIYLSTLDGQYLGVNSDTWNAPLARSKTPDKSDIWILESVWRIGERESGRALPPPSIIKFPKGLFTRIIEFNLRAANGKYLGSLTQKELCQRNGCSGYAPTQGSNSLGWGVGFDRTNMKDAPWRWILREDL